MRTAAIAIAMVMFAGDALAEERVARERLTENEKARIRGGFSLGGGLVAGNNVDVGGNAALALRLGAQLNRWFGLQYQNAPVLFAFNAKEQASTIGGFIDTNSALATVDLGDHLELAAGPSLDIAWLGGCDTSTVRCDATRGVAPGMHGRGSVIIGGRDAATGRRTGFAVGLDAHPVFFPNAEPILLLNLNVGMEVF